MASPTPTPTPAPSPNDADGLRGIVPPLRFGDWLSEHLPLVITLAALTLLVVIAVAVWLIRRRQPLLPADARTPRQRADERLRSLRSRADTLEARVFGHEACDILRDFLAAERRLPITRQTSEEFLADAARTRAVAPGEHALLADFLSACDGLKFARADATAEVKERLLTDAADFVTGTAANRPPPLPVVAA